MKDEDFLSRWSRLKRRAASGEPAPEAPQGTERPKSPPAAAPGAVPQGPKDEAPPPLPAVESLTIESDFSGFMQEQVDETLRRAALKKLFSDPRFNIMDGLDVYIDDYSKPDPLPPDWLAKMNQMAHLVVHDAPERAGTSEGEAGPEAVAEAEQAASPGASAGGERGPEPSAVHTSVQEASAPEGAESKPREG